MENGKELSLSDFHSVDVRRYDLTSVLGFRLVVPDSEKFDAVRKLAKRLGLKPSLLVSYIVERIGFYSVVDELESAFEPEK